MRLGLYLITRATEKQITADLFLMKMHGHTYILDTTKIPEQSKEAKVLNPVAPISFANPKPNLDHPLQFANPCSPAPTKVY